MSARPYVVLCLTTVAVVTAACSASAQVPMPRVIPHGQWQASPPVGHAADGTRRNLKPGDRLEFRDLAIEVLAVAVDSSVRTAPVDAVRLRLKRGEASTERSVREGRAFNWDGYHIAIVAIPNAGELGAGLVALEVATIASLPPAVAASDSAGGAALRLRVPHQITHITLHHSGDAEPLKPGDDVVAKLRNLQSWGERDRNWWDVPYHYLMDLEGRIYEGRAWQYMGETNTTYNPGGHFLITVIGNYEIQEPTPAQLGAIADLMAWAVSRFAVPLDRIGGHYNYADTDCPGKYLRRYLEDGTLKRLVQERLARQPGN
jgi:hypothetical protein